VSAVRRRWSRRLDHYYGITAFLAARGAQATTCRVVAAILFCLGAIPLMLIVGPAGPQTLRNRLLAVAISVCCWAMAAMWLRRRWPTRTESKLCVLVGTMCIAVACLIAAHPLIGILGSTAFAVLGAFVAFFHNVRLLAFTWTVGAATLVFLAMRLAAIDTALAVCTVVLVALVNIFAVFTCRMVIGLIITDVSPGEIEPLTGLLNRDAFSEGVAQLIGARSRDDDRYLVVAVVNLDSFFHFVDMTGASGGDQARVAIGQRLRQTVRRDAIVAHVSDAEFFIADVFTTADPAPLVERVRGAIKSAPFRLTVSIGVVSTPLRPLATHPAPEVVDEVLAIATTAMYEARRSGGNQTRHIRCPTLAVLDEPDSEDWPASGNGMTHNP
jgi:diguanylate cyclase (GGDEF)-like protein